jgi:hypothetical protein
MTEQVYISGKITGLDKAVYERNFARAAELIRAAGKEPVNPVEIELVNCGGVEVCGGEGEIHHWRCYMKHDLIALLNCDSIVVLPNWLDSKGACLEFKLADDVGMPSYAISYDYTSFYEWRNHHE